jgi:hypothetical protein
VQISFQCPSVVCSLLDHAHVVGLTCCMSSVRSLLRCHKRKLIGRKHWLSTRRQTAPLALAQSHQTRAETCVVTNPLGCPIQQRLVCLSLSSGPEASSQWVSQECE